MHVRELVETSCWVADHAPAFVAFSGPIAIEQIETYWAASRCRLDRWSSALKSLSTAKISSTPTILQRKKPARMPLIEEILVSEVLTRVWTAVAAAHDQHRMRSELAPVCRSIFIGHLEARNRALQLLVNHNYTALEEAVTLNRLRRRCERWTDLLLSRIAGLVDVKDLAFDIERVGDFQRELGVSSGAANSSFAWQLVLGSIRASFASGLTQESPSADLNKNIASSILSCLSSDLFDTTGQLKSTWVHRLERISDDTQGMIDDLMQEEPLTPTAPAPKKDHEPREYRNDGPHPLPRRRFPSA
jgi:hypothetical protein